MWLTNLAALLMQPECKLEVLLGGQLDRPRKRESVPQSRKQQDHLTRARMRHSDSDRRIRTQEGNREGGRAPTKAKTASSLGKWEDNRSLNPTKSLLEGCSEVLLVALTGEVFDILSVGPITITQAGSTNLSSFSCLSHIICLPFSYLYEFCMQGQTTAALD